MFDWAATILPQFYGSIRTTAVIGTFSQAVDPSTDLDNFYAFCLDVDTAQGFGLDIIGRIVGVTRVITVSNATYLGFAEAGGGSGSGNWGFGTWFGGVASSQNDNLDDVSYRLLLKAKMASNISDCSIPQINEILLALFPGDGDIFIADNSDMTATITSTFELTAVQVAILSIPGVLPRPAGVQYTISNRPTVLITTSLGTPLVGASGATTYDIEGVVVG